jgi:hypothetical protein
MFGGVRNIKNCQCPFCGTDNQRLFFKIKYCRKCKNDISVLSAIVVDTANVKGVIINHGIREDVEGQITSDGSSSINIKFGEIQNAYIAIL